MTIELAKIDQLAEEIKQLKLNIDRANANFISLDNMYKQSIQREHQYQAELILKEAQFERRKKEVENFQEINKMQEGEILFLKAALQELRDKMPVTTE